MKTIRFFYKSSGDDAPRGLDYFVTQDGTVWRDNYRTCESQSAVVGFDDFVMPCPELDWEIAVEAGLAYEHIGQLHPSVREGCDISEELERFAQAVARDIAAWYAAEGWLLDEDDVPGAIRARFGIEGV